MTGFFDTETDIHEGPIVFDGEVYTGVPVFAISEPIYDWSVTIGSLTIPTIKGREPNAFHRWMQEKLLGLKWSKESKQ